MRTDYESLQCVEVMTREGYQETEFTISLICTASSLPGSIDPLWGGEPPAGAEFELTTITVAVPRVNRQPNESEFVDPLELTWDHFVALVGEESAEFLFTEAVTDANENGGF